MHNNFFDMNKLYEQQRLNREYNLRKFQRKEAMRKEKKRLQAIKLAQFNRDIRKEDGKLDLMELNKLNSVYKTNYIKMVVEDIGYTE